MIHITDSQTNQILDFIPEEEFWDDNHHKSLKDTLEFFEFRTFGDKRYSQHLEKMNRIIIPDEDGTYIEFVIFHAIKYRLQSTVVVDVYAPASYLLLKKAKVIRPQKLEGYTAVQHTDFALAGTEWKVGRIDYAGIRTITIENHTNPYAYLKRIASEFDLELHFRVEVGGNKIVRRYVDLLERVGTWNGREVEFGKDLIGIERKEDFSNIVTALIGLSPEREDGTRLEIFVEDKEALARWGRNGQHIIDIYEPESMDMEMTEERLMSLTKNELKKRVNSVVEYTADIADLEKVLGLEHEKIRFGDTIRIKDIDFNPPLYLEARIHTMERSIKKNGYKIVTLGDYIEYTEEEVKAIWRSLQAQIAKKISMADVLEVTYTKSEIDEKDIPGKEAKAKIDRDVGEAIIETTDGSQDKADQAEHNAKNHADNVANQARQEAITEAVNQAQQALNSAVDELETSIAEKADAQWVSGQLQLKADNETVSVIQNTVGELQNTASSLQQAVDNHADQLEEQGGKITKLETDYDELEGSLNATITELSNLNETVSRHETQIEANAREIALKASQQEFDSLSGTVSDISGQLTVMAGQIEAKAEKSELQTLEDDVSQINTELSSLKVDVEGISTNVSSLSQTVTNHGTQISSINSSITQLSGEIESKVDKTEYETDKDGIINRLSSAETRISQTEQDIQARVTKTEYQQDKQELEGGISQLETRMSTAETNIQANTTAISLKANSEDVYTKTQVDTALGKKVDTTVYNQKIGELTTSINGISANVSNLQTTVGQHGSSISNLQSQVNIQAGQIASKVDATYVQGAIADIQVGGRNLVIRHNELKNKLIDTTGDIRNGQGSAVMEGYIPVTPNEVLTFTKTDSELASDGGYWRWRWSDAEKNYIARKADNRNEFQWIVPENTYFIQVSYPMDAFPKIERGNKATDWTPAPEDVQANIDDVYQYASSEIQQLAGQVSTKAEASTVTALGSRVSTAEQNISALQGQINQKVSITEFNALGQRVSTAEQDINALEGQITQKVSQSTFNALENRVTQAESTVAQTANNVTVAFNRIDSIDGVLNSAVTTIDASGITVKDGSFYLEDDTSDTKYSIVPKSNLLSDHSFEMVERTGSVDPTYGDFAVKQQIESFGKWKTVGSPRLLSAHQTDWVQFSLFYFGSQAIVVSSTNYVEQHFPYIPGKTYTVSAYFTGSSRSTSGVPRIDVRLEQGITGEVKKTWTKSFQSVTFGQKLTRCALTFTVPADADNNLGGDIVMVTIRANSGWVVVDGIQVVEGETPTLYEPENAVWELLYGRYEGRGFTGDYTIVDYGSNENGNFVRFGQGLQICWFQTEINMEINNQYGVLYQNSMKWTYPATFAVAPNVCVGEARWSTGASWGTPTATERLNTDIRVIDVSSRSSGRTRIKAIAIGRWK